MSEPTLFEKSRPGRRASLPPAGASLADAARWFPEAARRKTAPGLPEIGELDLVRHYTRLSRNTFSIDANFYPLGSCTMKYNPRVNEVVAAMPGFRDLHPYARDEDAQGALEVLFELERILAEVAGMDAVSLQPSAGAHGELAALLVCRAHFRDRGERHRTRVLIPDSAHGTNPASAAIAGLQCVEVRSGEDGFVDLADLRSKVGPDLAVFMITNPNTLGLFEPRIADIARIVHDQGGLVYLDGANMNAITGVARPGDFGADVMHFNTHKTYSTPHGGGGPGAGPIAVKRVLEPYLPAPRVARDGDRLRLDHDRPKSIGRVRSFSGSFGILLRAYAYLRSHSADDMRGNAENAVLNANYLLALLRDKFDAPYPGPCMHEFVLSLQRDKRAKGVRALDVAKALLDRGYHPPTIYFPLIVPECLMIEPTETETKETLDAFAKALRDILDEAYREADAGSEHPLGAAPRTTPVGRLDEVTAARKPIVRQPPSVQLA